MPHPKHDADHWVHKHASKAEGIHHPANVNAIKPAAKTKGPCTFHGEKLGAC